MSSLFESDTMFNGDISGWDTSQVTTMNKIAGAYGGLSNGSL